MTRDSVAATVDGPLGVITLSRPDRLGALSFGMIQAIRDALDAWAADGAVQAIVIRGENPKVFAAGGDVRALADLGPERLPEIMDFFQAEYGLNHAVKAHPKPIVAFMDGVVMGGGAGVSVHATYRVAGDHTLFAMPETAIGHIPDIGGSFFLPRLRQRLGIWMGLTGARLGPADAVVAGVADYLSPTARRDAVLAALRDADYADGADEAICEVLALNAVAPPPAAFKPNSPEIEHAFAAEDLGGVLDALDAGSDWAKTQAATIRAAAPFATALTFEMLRRGAPDGPDVDPVGALGEALKREYRLTRVCVARGDFHEGVRARLIDKSNDPVWSPASLAAVDPAEIAAAFEPAGDELRL